MRDQSVILLFGAPGSGKGTQSSILSKKLGIPSLSTGDILRAEAKANTPFGFRLRELMASGGLVSDDLVCASVASRIRKEAVRGGLILDGFPRTTAQAIWLKNLLAEMRAPSPIVLHLDVPEDVLVKRTAGRRHCATCGAVYNLMSRMSASGSRCEIDGGALVERDDDRESVIRRRFADYEESTAPVLALFRSGDYHRIDGNRDAEEVTSDLTAIVSRVSPALAA
jgi:adenylate kinase